MSKKLNGINLPDTDKIMRDFERISKMKTPDFEAIIKEGLPDTDKIMKDFERMSKMKPPDFEAFIKKGLPDTKKIMKNFDKIVSMSDSLAGFPNVISEIDWTNLELNKEDIEQAEVLLESENPEEELLSEINNKELSDRIYTYLKYIAITLLIIYRSIMIFETDTVQEIVVPALQSVVSSDSEKYTIKHINDELKKDIPRKIKPIFRIVIKDNLIVRNNNKVNSKINGELNSKDIVRIKEKNRNWTHVEYVNHDKDVFIEGWVFTRYLKQIK